MFSMDKKKTIKNLFNMAIESKKNIFQGGTITKGDIKETNMAISEAVKLKIQNLLKIFMNPSLEKIFSTTKKALARNKKIAKINEVYQSISYNIGIEIVTKFCSFFSVTLNKSSKT